MRRYGGPVRKVREFFFVRKLFDWWFKMNGSPPPDVVEIDNPLAGLVEWCASQNEDYLEIGFGVRIEQLDNPGWSLSIDLKYTNLLDRELIEKKIDRTDLDWIVARKQRRDGTVFYESFGGLGNLEEMLSLFLKWAR
ncbi:Imm53 family immunity protein [Segnochrobactraceae bacterium EtOH-i3]